MAEGLAPEKDAIKGAAGNDDPLILVGLHIGVNDGVGHAFLVGHRSVLGVQEEVLSAAHCQYLVDAHLLRRHIPHDEGVCGKDAAKSVKPLLVRLVMNPYALELAVKKLVADMPKDEAEPIA